MPAAARAARPAPAPAAAPARAAGGPAPAVAGGPAVKLSGPAANDPRFRKVADQLDAAAKKETQHDPAGKAVADAQAAAAPPANEKLAGAKAAQAAEMKAAEPGKPEPNSFLAVLRAEIEKVMPKNLGEAANFMKGGETGRLKGAVAGNVRQQEDAAAGGVKAATEKPPDPSGVPGKEVTPLPAEAAPAAPAVDASGAAPPPKPDAAVSLAASKQDADKQMADASVTPQQLKKANDPRFSAVLSAKANVERQADAAPPAYRSKEKATLGGAVADAQGRAKAGLGAMRSTRTAGKAAVKSRQQQAKEKDEAARKAVVDQIEQIYAKTKTAVEGRLATLETDVLAAFDKGVESALAAMKEDVDRRMLDYKLRRYLVNPLGPALWIKDQLLGLPDEVNVFIVEARTKFTGRMDALINQIAATVESRLKDAKAEIARGEAEIHSFVARQPKDLQAVAKGAEQAVSGRFRELEQGIEEKKNDLAQKLAEKYKEAQDKADQMADQMRAENRGLIDEFKDKLGAVIKALLEFKARLMGLLRKGEETIKLILADPIQFLSNLLAAIKQGLNQFVGNIWTHLKAGFMQWLFGTLADAGVTLPKDLSLPSILQLVLQILGLTYDRLRAKAVKLIGERNVRILEKLYDYVKTLITEGPAALWEKVKGDLSDLKGMVIDAIQDWVVTTVVKAAITKIVSMFNPAGAIVQAILAIYNTVMFFIERASQIMALIEAVINSIHSIATGAIGGAANWIEQSLARLIPVAIGFLARLLGLGGISDKIRQIIQKVQGAVDRAIDKVLAKIVALVRKLFGKGKDAPGEASPEQDAKVQAGLAEIEALDQSFAKDGQVSREDAEKVAAKVKADNPVFKSVRVVEGEETWDYDYVASPGKRYAGPRKRGGQISISTIRVKDPETAEKVEQARHVSGREWELAVAAAVVKEVLVPKWEIVIRVPIEIVVRGQKEFDYPSREDLARLKVQRGHRTAQDPTRFPEVTMEVKKPGGGGALKQARFVEITLVEDFTQKDDFAVHKTQQFFATMEIFKKKYGDQVPIEYTFLAPRKPTDKTQQFIRETLSSLGLTNVKVKWVVVKTK
jgi:hypothetical protein